MNWAKVVSISPGAGMSLVTAKEQMDAVMRVGRKINGRAILKPQIPPYYVQFAKRKKG